MQLSSATSFGLASIASLACLVACFGGAFVQGLPCTDDDDCGDELSCDEGLCGGPGQSPPVCGNALVEPPEECDGNDAEAYPCGEDCRWTDHEQTLFVSPARNVDILFVLDNSGSMAQEQAILTSGIAPLIQILDAIEASYRIGFTTTDNGNPWCPSGLTTPESGKLALTPCTEHLDDFIFGNGLVDARALACTDICSLDADELAILPTTTAHDDQPLPRPWLEKIGGQQNLPATTDFADAVACFMPQGINGCGFESQLESMIPALTGVHESDRDFIREDASLAVVFLSDEADCSYNKQYESIFWQEGSQTFWTDPSASFPSSAVCWNAGVSCTGDPSGYDSCEPVNKDVYGNEGVAEGLAALLPMSRYIDALAELEAQKQAINSRYAVTVALIGGVAADGSVHYSDGLDPTFLDNFGIGPGCEGSPLEPGGEPSRATPPVRMRALVDAHSPGNLSSICEPDYFNAFASVSRILEDQIHPGCYTRCVADSDPGTEMLEPECTVTEHHNNGSSVFVDECVREGDAYLLDTETQDYALPEDVDLCYVLRVDSEGLSPSANDDLSEFCEDRGSNLELHIVRRPGVIVEAGRAVSIDCELDRRPDLRCPDIEAAYNSAPSSPSSVSR